MQVSQIASEIKVKLYFSGSFLVLVALVTNY